MTTTETRASRSPAADLRLAAEGLRKDAAAATPGPWKHMCLGSEGCLVIRDHATIRERGRGRIARFGSKDWKADHADAEYVASMDPVVGAALADWLEDVARDADEMLKLDTPECVHEDGPCACGPLLPEWGCDRCGEYLAPGACTCWEKPLAVARAYLAGAK
jgi:hypothetical protein